MVAKQSATANNDAAVVAANPHPLEAALAKIGAAMNADPHEQQLAILRQTLNAETVDEIFEESQIDDADAVLGIPHHIVSVDYHKSAFDEGMPVFATVTGKNAETGAAMLYNVGAGTPLAQLMRAAESLPLPYALKLKQKDRPTANGFFPLFYVKA